MKKILFILTLSLISSFTFAQSSFNFVLEGQLINTTIGDTLQFLQNTGKKNVLIASIPIDKKGKFHKKIQLKDKDYYILMYGKNQKMDVIVTGEGKANITADAHNLFNSISFQDSPENQKLVDFMRIENRYKAKLDSANTYLKAHMGQQAQIKKSFQPIYQNFLKERTDFIKNNSKSPALISVLSTINLKQEFGVYKSIVDDLKAGFGESPTVQRIAAQYKINYKKMQSMLPIPIGSEEKDIALPDPAGDTLRLSDLKGKVVLLDFWASWCRPCRHENPNVVKAYKKYHDKGFTVFSVSLDSKKDRWKQAIAQDGLVWNTHVSDLKGWSSGAARLYNVHSIPHSFLIDKNGKIIANNLRGEALQNKLESIFGD